MAISDLCPRKSRGSVYSLFGLTLTSYFSFANRLAPGIGSPDLTFSCISSAPRSVDWDHVAPVHTSPIRTDDGESVAQLYRLGACDVLRFSPIADFYLSPNCIVCHLWDPAYDYLVEISLLGLCSPTGSSGKASRCCMPQP